MRTEELDRVLEPFLPYIESSYRMLVDEKVNANSRVGLLSLEITIRKNVSTPEDSIKLQIGKALMENMRLSQNMRIKDAVAGNLIEIPTVTVVPSPDISIKRPRLRRIF